MGDWPTKLDKSATLRLSDGQRIFVASPLGLSNIGFQIAKHQTKSTLNALCCTLEGRQDKNVIKITQLLRLVGGAGVSALNNQNLTRNVTEHIRSGKLIAFALPPTTLLPLAGSIGMARSLAPTMINLPSLEGIDPENPDVTSMDEGQRMLWVLLKCGEVLERTGKSEIATAFKQLLKPEIIGLIVAGLIVWGASHFVGVGFIFDIAMVVVMGVAVIKAFETMWEIYKIITRASSKTELTRAAQMMADMVINIGVQTFLAIVLKGAAKSRFRAPPNKAAGTVDEAAEAAPAAKKKAQPTVKPPQAVASKTVAPKPYTGKKPPPKPISVKNDDGTLKLNKAAQQYAKAVKSNSKWNWKDSFNDKLTPSERLKIREHARSTGLVPKISYKPGTKYPDFQKAGIVQKIDKLPKKLWKASDRKQFEWLDARIAGGKPPGTTWHHSEISGRMELVPFGPHNTINHIGGRSPGHWAHGGR